MDIVGVGFDITNTSSNTNKLRSGKNPYTCKRTHTIYVKQVITMNTVIKGH